MSEFVKLCTIADLPGEGKAVECMANGRPLCVARVKGEITAMDNECPHNGGPLAEGAIEGGKIICPWHGWAFDRHTGAADHNPAAVAEVFEIRIDGDQVFAKL